MSKKEYDYIIAGGGTAGCAVAGRLAEDDSVSVLVVEAGAHNRDLESVHMVGDYHKNFFGPQSWNIKSVPMPSCNDREIALHRGKFLGGSSGTNTTFCIRGTKQDFDDWGLPGWSGEEMFAAMRKAETFHPKPWFDHDPKAHGDSGPVHIEPHDIAPISEMMLKSFQGYGLPLHDDMLSNGEYPIGCGHALRTHHNGVRSTGADYITKGREKRNIEVLPNTMVDKVNLEKDGDGWRAASVDLLGADGTRYTAKARREIIVSGGAYCSPAILMRSGIGDRSELEKLGIQCHVDLPGVGKNLQDHVIAFVPYEVKEDCPGITTDHLSWHEGADEKNREQWAKDKSGFLSIMPFGCFAFGRVDERLKDSQLWQDALKQAPPGRDPLGLDPKKQPSFEIFHTESAPPGVPLTEKQAHVICTIVELFQARSRGTVKLASADPFDKPLVDHNYFGEILDLEVFSEAAHFANEIVMKGAGTADVMQGSWPPDGNHHAFKNREEWKPWIRQHCQTCYHPTGTCKMGIDGDPMAVLDAKARVRGVKGLRVADCSTMPVIPNGHTQFPAYGVGERVADFIKEGAGAPNRVSASSSGKPSLIDKAKSALGVGGK